MKGYNNNSKNKKSSNRKISSDSISSSLMKTTISIFKNKIDHSLLNQNEKYLNSTKKSGKSFFLSEKKNSTQLPIKRYDIKKYNNIIKESNKSRFLKSFYNPNPKYKLYLNNSTHSTIIQASLNTRKSENMALFQKEINSRKKRILNNSLSQNIPNSFRRQTAEEHKMPIRNLLLFSTKNKDINKRNKIFDRQNIKIENYQYKRKTNSFNEDNQNKYIGKYTEKKKFNLFNKRSSDSNLLNKIIGNKKLFKINRISLNNEKYELRKRNSMNDIEKKIRGNIELKNINRKKINTSLFLKNNISENEIKTTIHKNSIKIVSKINLNNQIQSSTHKNSFISFQNIYNNEMKHSSDKNIKNNINNYVNKNNNDNNMNNNDNISNNGNKSNYDYDNDSKNIDDNTNNNDNNNNDIKNNNGNNNNDSKNNNDNINNNNINDDDHINNNDSKNNSKNNKDGDSKNNNISYNDNKIINDNDNINNNDNDNKNNDDNENNNESKNNNDNKIINDNDNINNNDNDNKNNDDNENKDESKNNSENINIEIKRNSIYSSIHSIKKNEIIPESKRNSIYSIIRSSKKNEIIGESKRNSKEMIDNNDKNEMNNIINRKSFDSLNDINKNQDIPISDIKIINNEKDNKIDIKKNENNINIDNNEDEENKKSTNINNDNDKNGKEKEKEIKMSKKKVCFSTKYLLQYKNGKNKNKENKENNRVASLKNRNLNRSTTNLFSFESDSQNISDLSKEELKYDRKSFKKKSKKETINLTKKLLVENTKEKLKIINRYIKKNKSSLLIDNKIPNLKNKNFHFLNKIYDDIDQFTINKNNNHIINEKVKLLKSNHDNINSLLNELKNDMKNSYDINITEELDEIFDKNNDLNLFKICSDLIIPCNINYKLCKYIFRNIEFKGVVRNQFIEDQRANKYEIIKKKSSRKSVLSFPSIKNNKLFFSKLERFLVDKTNLIRKDEDSKWKKEKYNFMMVHKFKIKSLSWAKNENALISKNNSKKFEVFQRNDYNQKVRNTLHVSKRKIIGIQRISVASSINTKILNRTMLKKKTISLFKRPSLDLRSSIKKKRKKNFNKISILINKAFFNRKNETNLNYAKKKSSIFDFENDNEGNKINDINPKIILEYPKNIDDVYFGLTLLIANGKEFQFIKYFNKYEKILDIDFPIYEGNTLLMMSTKEGMAGITRFLCEKKADVNLKNDRGNTALHYAIGQKFFKIADILTIFGAREDILNNKGQSPWDC